MRFKPIGLAACTIVFQLGCSVVDDVSSARDPISLSAAVNADTWSGAVSVDPLGVGAINTPALEGCPHEAPNGQSLFFASDRSGNLDIWVTQRQADGSWSAPAALPAPVNSTAGDFCPTPLPGGGLLFVSTRSTDNCGTGTADIYETHLLDSGEWAAPRNLGCTVNSARNEFSPSQAGAAGGMLFFSSDRGGKHELYVSMRDAAGNWDAPSEISELNATGWNTARPNVSADGREIVFDSDRAGGYGSFDVWSSHRATPTDAWSAPVNAGSAVNSSASETRPTLTRNGRQLYFGSTRVNFQGSSDLFTAYR